MTSRFATRRLRRGRSSASSLVIVLALMTPARVANAEYAENRMGRDLAAWTLGTAGLGTLVLGTTSAAYTAAGAWFRDGRVAVGVTTIAVGALTIAGSSLALATVGEAHVPPGASDDDATRVSLRQARVLGGVGVGLGGFGVGLGIAALVSGDGPSTSSRRPPPFVVFPTFGAATGVGCAIAF